MPCSLLVRKWNTLVLAVLAEVVWFGSSLPFLDGGSDSLPVRVYGGLSIVGMYAVPAMCLYGYPVHLLASHVTRRLPDWKRLSASLGIHLGFAAAVGMVIPGFLIPALLGALLFFMIGEGCDQLERTRGRKTLNRLTALLALPIVISWLVGGALVWKEHFLANREMDELRAAGPPRLILRTEKGTVEVHGNGIAYSNVKPQPGEIPDAEDMPALYPAQLPAETPVVEAKPGETIRFAFPGIPGTPTIRLVRSEQGTPVRETPHKSAFQAPENPGIYPYVMTAEWGERADLRFTALFAVRVGETR